MIGFFVKIYKCGFLVCMIKTGKYLDINNCSCEKCLFRKLVLTYEGEILNSTETSLVDQKVTCEKNDYLISTISLVMISLLLCRLY